MTIGLMVTLDAGLWIHKLKKNNGSPGRPRSDVPVGPVNDDLPGCHRVDPVTIGLMVSHDG